MQALVLSMLVAVLATPAATPASEGRPPAAAAAPLAGVPGQSPARPTGKGPPPAAVDRKLGEGAIDFRCDNMFIYTKPNRNVCKSHVVIRRGDMLVCCEVFEGTADEKWVWQSFVCKEDVRAQRGIETVWADKAEFLTAENDLVLTGHPVLHRGESILEGERVILDVKEDHARISKPRGRMDTEPNKLPAQPPPLPTGPLPALCPIPALKR